MSFVSKYPYTSFHELNLDWLINKVKETMDRVEILEDWKTTHESEYEELKALYDQIISGNFPPSITQAFEDWMERNALDLVGELVHMVFFGLTDSGYFAAYIPESWDDITFGTSGLDDFPAGVDYGHLTLSY